MWQVPFQQQSSSFSSNRFINKVPFRSHDSLNPSTVPAAVLFSWFFVVDGAVVGSLLLWL